MGGANAVWLLGCRVGADLLSFALFLIVSRRFGPEGLGAYAYGFAIAGIVYAFTTSGIEEYGIREYARRLQSDGGDVAARSRLMSDVLGAQLCLAALVLAALAIYLLLTRPSSDALAIVLTMCTYQVGSAFAGTLFVPAMAEQRMHEPALTELLCRAGAFVAVGAAILIVEQPLADAVLGFAFAGPMMALIGARSTMSRGLQLRPRVTRAAMREGARTLWSFASVNALNQLFTRIGVIALTLQVSSAAAGVYATGLKLVETMLLPIVFMGVAAYPRLSQAYASNADFDMRARRLLLLGLALALPASFALFFVVPHLLVPVLGERFDGAQPVIAAMAALLFVQAGEAMFGRVLLSANRHVERAAALGIGSALCVATTLLATPRFGAAGALSVAVSAYLLVNVLYALNVRRALRPARLMEGA